ncbi:MAG: hypothetical protein B7Y05_24100 [Polynucleobacter sp. 24-46-87]|jgi:hypothetical protein|nr:MAG: hypothetical protein B7Y55_09560 [Polynucleobacter sp. 35-46-207]OYZ37375.1 MAG: hypothetical protein B7Y22_03560 [Polynucleobacter sp. 16-46-70]OZA01679.1 MAG: hypothetical protein B7Y05_24100 [Polynucleobacter sp. 24-46-87]OZA33070.1 MAG: hypothetical protein B7X83_07580 [Polynucleobacter sp. 17-46-58]OZB39151.1 MAG: hypothetical protein B7X60_12105 [Polynucleobacter sp. 39-45-136]HQR84080.1 hypothetical protein [Polynucleobacter sp.]
MNTLTDFVDFPIEPFLRDAAWGILGLLFVLIFHGSAINHVFMRFEILTRQNLAASQYNRVFFHFYAAFVFIALIHILEILIWSILIVSLNLISDPVRAILFAGSCYTTVGFESDFLPDGWKTLAFFISFTGLFSLAWTTSIMIGMTTAYKKAWNLKYGEVDVH